MKLEDVTLVVGAIGTEPVVRNAPPAIPAALRSVAHVPRESGQPTLRLVRPPADPNAVTAVRLQRDGAHFVLPLGRSSVGRAQEVSVHLESPDVSRRHATIVVSPTQVTVEDSSANGTTVNGRRIERSSLSTGDLIAFAGIVFQVELIRLQHDG